MRLTYATDRSSESARASCVIPRSCRWARTFSPSLRSTSRRGSRCCFALVAIRLEVLILGAMCPHARVPVSGAPPVGADESLFVYQHAASKQALDGRRPAAIFHARERETRATARRPHPRPRTRRLPRALERLAREAARRS